MEGWHGLSWWVLGVILGAYLYYRKTYTPLLSGADLLALATPVGLLLGALPTSSTPSFGGAQLICLGRHFPGRGRAILWSNRGPLRAHPSQLYEALLEGLLLGAVLIYLAFTKAH